MDYAVLPKKHNRRVKIHLCQESAAPPSSPQVTLCGPCRSVKPSSASKILYNATLTCLREKSGSGVLKGQNVPLIGIQSVLKSEGPHVRRTSHVLQAARSSSTKLRLVVDIKCGNQYTKCRGTFQHLLVPIATRFFLTFRMCLLAKPEDSGRTGI
jgi:hypothetical protein